jgi:hypothetical protein
LELLPNEWHKNFSEFKREAINHILFEGLYFTLKTLRLQDAENKEKIKNQRDIID